MAQGTSILQANKTAQAQIDSAGVARQADYNAINAQRSEINQSTTSSALQLQAETMRQRATLRVAQGESGLVGPTQLREIAANRAAEAANLATLEANRSSANAQVERNLVNVDINAAGRMNEANSRVLGPLAAGLQIAGAGLQSGVQGYVAGKSIFPTKKYTK
jgi:hypothetical protein